MEGLAGSRVSALRACAATRACEAGGRIMPPPPTHLAVGPEGLDAAQPCLPTAAELAGWGGWSAECSCGWWHSKKGRAAAALGSGAGGSGGGGACGGRGRCMHAAYPTAVGEGLFVLEPEPKRSTLGTRLALLGEYRGADRQLLLNV